MLRRFALLLVVGVLASALTVAVPSTGSAFSDRDCADFDTQSQAQRFFLDQGGPSDDPHRLDADGDGQACDSLPCPCGAGSGGSSGSAGASAGSTVRQRGRVIRVVDGDTLEVRLSSGARRTVRMLGIDTPEVYGGTTQCGGPQASRSLVRLLPRGTAVRLISDNTQARTDRYGRILRYVERLRDDRDMDRAQVRRGWARVYVYDNVPFTRVASYRKAQRSAQAADRGIWGLC